MWETIEYSTGRQALGLKYFDKKCRKKRVNLPNMQGRQRKYTAFHIFTQVLFLAGNHGIIIKLESHHLSLIFIEMKYVFELKIGE